MSLSLAPRAKEPSLSKKPPAKPTIRWPVVRAALAEASRAGAARAGRLLRWPRRARTPSRLLFAPQDLRAADPTVAAEIESGLFVFADRHPPVQPGRSPFEIEAPSWAWAEELYGFAWLRDLDAAGTEAAKASARALTIAALRSSRRVLERGVARRPAVVARRAIAMLSHSPFLLTNADHDFYHRYLRRIGRDAAMLRRSMERDRSPRDRLAAAIGLAYVGLASAGLERRVAPASRIIERELARQVLAEDAPVARNGSALIELLLDLLPLRLLYGSRSLAVPPGIAASIERALPILATLRHGDGGLALFNGSGLAHPGDLALIFSDDRIADPGEGTAGYARLAAGNTLVVVDTGKPPPLVLSAGSHAAPLAFEMSSGAQRIVVNAGSPPHPGPARDAARRTSAHSTLVLDDESAGILIDDVDRARGSRSTSYLAKRLGPVLLAGAKETVGTRGSQDGALTLTGHHDGYLHAFGAVHTRTLRLKEDGSELEGEDAVRFMGRSAYPAAKATLHFHLHPAVEAREEEGGAGIVLDLPGGERWRFGAIGATPRLAPSLYFAVTEGRRGTRQIVVDLPPAEGDAGSSLRWIFIRE